MTLLSEGRYEIVIKRTPRDAAKVGLPSFGPDSYRRTNGREAGREMRRRVKRHGPLVLGSLYLWLRDGRNGRAKRKLITQCHTDARGRLSSPGEEL